MEKKRALINIYLHYHRKKTIYLKMITNKNVLV